MMNAPVQWKFITKLEKGGYKLFLDQTWSGRKVKLA